MRDDVENNDYIILNEEVEAVVSVYAPLPHVLATLGKLLRVE